jgi:hypothetical protein
MSRGPHQFLDDQKQETERQESGMEKSREHEPHRANHDNPTRLLTLTFM